MTERNVQPSGRRRWCRPRHHVVDVLWFSNWDEDAVMMSCTSFLRAEADGGGPAHRRRRLAGELSPISERENITAKMRMATCHGVSSGSVRRRVSRDVGISPNSGFAVVDPGDTAIQIRPGTTRIRDGHEPAGEAPPASPSIKAPNRSARSGFSAKTTTISATSARKRHTTFGTTAVEPGLEQREPPGRRRSG